MDGVKAGWESQGCSKDLACAALENQALEKTSKLKAVVACCC